MVRSTSRLMLAGAVFTGIAAAPLCAQDSSAVGYDLRGVITSSDGDAVRRAQVSVIGVDAKTFANDSGQFFIDRLPAGTRVVEFRALGYEPRYLPVGIGPKTQFLFVTMHRITHLDSVRVVAVSSSEYARRIDILGEKELNAPDIIGGSALNAVALLRPQMLRTRTPTSFSSHNEAAERGQLFQRVLSDSNPSSNPLIPRELAELTTTAGSLTVSVDEGPLGSPDILIVIPARRVREIRLLRPLEAASRFGPSAASGPVLIVYTK